MVLTPWRQARQRRAYRSLLNTDSL